MSELKEYNLMSVKDMNKTVHIPKIQRDYAEGRHNPKVEEIRRTFLNNLLRAVFSDDEKIHLDFIYGNDKYDMFEPLDGQQRLTTLFLLHWFFTPEGKDDNLLINGKSMLAYATRYSSENFCNELVCHPARIILRQLTRLNNDIKEQNNQIRKRNEDIIKQKKETSFNVSDFAQPEDELPIRDFSSFIKSKDWFLWEWNNDPTIISMLNVLDSIISLMDENSYEYENAKYDNLNNITFHYLNLGSMNISDELYIKMNARGKALSDFDIMKSSIEEEIQLQGLTGTQTEKDWRNFVDGNWIDFFWQRYVSEHDMQQEEIGYHDVYNVEANLMHLLQRLLAYQYFFNCEDADFQTLCMQGWQVQYDKFVSQYSLRSWLRRLCGHQLEQLHAVADPTQIEKEKIERLESKKYPVDIDFGLLINDMNNLFYRDSNDKIHFIMDLIPDFRWVPDAPVFLDICINGNQARDLQVGFYSLLIFVRHFPANSVAVSQARINDLLEWMRFVRNTVLLNNTTQRIENEYKQQRAVHDLSRIFDGFCNSGQSVLQYLETVGLNEVFPGLENGRLEEQRIKSKCRRDIAWAKELDFLEGNHYLWGEVIAPLIWSMNKDTKEPDFNQFKKYSHYLNLIFDGSTNNDFLVACLLSIRDYRFNYGSQDKILLCELYDKYRSWKAAMRTCRDDNFYCEILKEFIDVWDVSYNSANHLLEVWQLIQSDYCQTVTEDWRWCTVKNPNLLQYAQRKYVWTDENTHHTFLREKIQPDTQHRSVVLQFIYKTLQTKDIECFDWYNLTSPNTITFDNIVIGLCDNCKYYLEENGTKHENLSLTDILSRIGI